MSNEYTGKVEARDDLMSVQAFRDCVRSGLFTDYDGFGYPVKFFEGIPKHSQVIVKPSTGQDIPADATHIVWYNR